MPQVRTHQTCIIVSVGDELALGQTVDTNSSWLAAQMAERGVFAVRHITVDDDLPRLTRALRESIEEADLVIMTGGLGPTEDDLTRAALCEVTGDRLMQDDAALLAIQQWFKGRTMSPANTVQAMRPTRAICLPNHNGTAPGLWMYTPDADICCLPGPPSEMKPMVETELLPRLLPETAVLTRVLHTVGLGESVLAERLGQLMNRAHNPLVGTTASNGIVSVRMRWNGTDQGEGRQLLDSTEHAVRETCGPVVIEADGNLTGTHALVTELIDLLTAHNQMLGVCESCTAGMIASTVAEVPGSSSVLAGGFVTYSNALKTALAGVEPSLIAQHGAVSREVACSMAEGTRERMGVDHALAVTGIAGPGGGSEIKPVGTVWIALASSEAPTDTRLFRFKGSREIVRQRACVMALAMLRQRLCGYESPLLAEVR